MENICDYKEMVKDKKELLPFSSTDDPSFYSTSFTLKVEQLDQSHADGLVEFLVSQVCETAKEVDAFCTAVKTRLTASINGIKFHGYLFDQKKLLGSHPSGDKVEPSDNENWMWVVACTRLLDLGLSGDRTYRAKSMCTRKLVPWSYSFVGVYDVSGMDDDAACEYLRRIGMQFLKLLTDRVDRTLKALTLHDEFRPCDSKFFQWIVLYRFRGARYPEQVTFTWSDISYDVLQQVIGMQIRAATITFKRVIAVLREVAFFCGLADRFELPMPKDTKARHWYDIYCNLIRDTIKNCNLSTEDFDPQTIKSDVRRMYDYGESVSHTTDSIGGIDPDPYD